MKKVLIMLSTYNGEKYLREQLDSLYNQDNVEIHILIRDDGSKDGTLNILKEYEENYHNISVIKGENVGATKSFHCLIKEASLKHRGYDYYAFCDQDDVWYNDKLSTACKCLNAESCVYKLYFCIPEIVDESLHIKNVAHTVIKNNLYGNIVSSHILGCTMVLNYALIEKVACLVNSEYILKDNLHIPLHDGWTALVAYALDSAIVYDRTPHIKYRQHGNNVVGAGQSSWKKLKNRIQRYLNKGGQKQQKCVLLYNLLSVDIPEKNKQVISKVIDYRNNVISKASLLFDKKIYQYDFTTNIGLFLMITSNKF